MVRSCCKCSLGHGWSLMVFGPRFFVNFGADKSGLQSQDVVKSATKKGGNFLEAVTFQAPLPISM